MAICEMPQTLTRLLGDIEPGEVYNFGTPISRGRKF